MTSGGGTLPAEVFLSHSSADARFVGRLADTMRRHGLPVWYSATNILGAQQWHDEIGSALGRCDWFVVVLTEAATESVWVKRELLYALNDRRYDGRIIPVRKQNCDYAQLSWTLDASQFVDFTGRFADGCRSLFRILGLGYDDAG